MAGAAPKQYSLFQRTVRLLQMSYRRFDWWLLDRMPGLPVSPEEMARLKQPLFKDLWEFTWADHRRHFREAWIEYKEGFSDPDDEELEKSKQEVVDAARRLRGHVEETTTKNTEYLTEKLEGTQVMANMTEIRATTEQNLGFIKEEFKKTTADVDAEAIAQNLKDTIAEHRSKDDVVTTLTKNVDELVDLVKTGRDAALELDKKDVDVMKATAQSWFADKLVVGQSVVMAFVEGYKEGKDMELHREDALLISFAKQAAEDQKEFVKEHANNNGASKKKRQPKPQPLQHHLNQNKAHQNHQLQPTLHQPRHPHQKMQQQKQQQQPQLHRQRPPPPNILINMHQPSRHVESSPIGDTLSLRADDVAANGLGVSAAIAIIASSSSKHAPSDGHAHDKDTDTETDSHMLLDPYAELRKHAGSAHPQKAKLNIVLSAITDVIYERRGQQQPGGKPISPTEYFAALMTALESASASHLVEITQLLAMVLPYVPEPVLRAKFPAVSKCMIRVVHEAVNAEQEEGSQALVRSACGCLGMLLVAQEPSNAVWARPDALKGFQVLLSLSTDARPKLRKVAQKSMADLLEHHADNQCDALSTHIASFAENVFAASQAKDEARIVQLIGFLKSALPFLQRKVVSSLVEALCKFLNSSIKTLRLVTLEALAATATASQSKISQDTLAKMISAVLNAEGSTVHEPELAIHAVPMLEAALVRLYTLNEAQARKFLPRVVVHVCAHMASRNEQVQEAAAQSLLLVLTQCLPADVLATQTQSTDVIRIVSSLESLLTLRFQPAWKYVFDVLAELFSFYGEQSCPAFTNILKTCCELREATGQVPKRHGSRNPRQKRRDDDEHKELVDNFEKVASAAVAAIGPAKFLEIVPIEDPDEIVSEKRLWLLRVFQESLRAYPCELEFFASKFLALARDCEARSRADDATPLTCKKFQMLTMQLWNLFPSFCANAKDIDTGFKKIAKTLANAMADQRYPELRLAVCQGLQALVKKTRKGKSRVHRDEEDEDIEEEEDDGDEDEEVDEEKRNRDRAALAKYASRYLPLLITFVEELDAEKDAENAQILLETVEGFASLAEASFVSATFKKIMQTLLEATTEAKKLEASSPGSPKLQQLKRSAHCQMALAMALLGHMDMESVNLLYRVIKPYLLDDTDPAMQKRSYAVMVSICDHHPSFLTAESNIKDMTESICESLLTCSVPAKKMRLRCLVHLITALSDVEDVDVDNLIPNLVGEIMLCTKEANGKAREAAFDLLVAMARLMAVKRPETGLMEYLQMVLGGLAARTPHMRSASVICLSRIVFEFGRTEVVIQQAMPQLLKTVLMLLHEKAREVIKSVIGFMKLGIAMLSSQDLEPFLPDIINGLLVWIGESKNRFRAKTRIILIKLCRKYGYEKIAEMVPPEDRALIKHIKKTKEREDKKKTAAKDANASESFDKFMNDDDDEEDEVDNEEASAAALAMALKRKKTMLQKKKVIKEGEDDIVDFLDSHAAVKNIYTQDDDEDMSDDDGIEFTTAKDGRMIIPDDNKAKEGSDSEDEDDEETIKMDVAKQLEKMGLSQKKRKRDDEAQGREYKAKKAAGDMKKKGKLEPYAYIPLDPKAMSKRHKRAAVDRYSGNVGKRKGKGKK
ncbi:TPA: LOW QUALITY PROTEIN: hypothetical protein N0F65_010553 [Lagenidium giganteum]|uniref:Ribosomal RNA-processing protein 12-like conserved domain-containing protein n=1 Tax=Lagenidium giganteum TaxID=4803 RepID=A0AAV2YMR0_9STRA|nr:TPA: LOW QUALITY PROTEIN: hypothetical protein N0F65_010553 [Lagenidium giganteum]